MRRAQRLSYTAKEAAKERQKFFRSPKLLVAGLFLARQGDVVEADQGNALVFRALLSLREHAGDDGDLHADLFGESEGRLDGAAGGEDVYKRQALLQPHVQAHHGAGAVRI